MSTTLASRLKPLIIISATIYFYTISLPSFSQMGGSKNADTTKKVNYAAVPMVNYNRSFGFMIGAMGSAYYKVNKKDTISPSSSTMVAGMYSTSNTYMALVIQQLYLKEDKWRIKMGLGTGEVFFQYFQDIPGFSSYGAEEDDGVWVDFNTSMRFFLINVQRKTLKHLYIGAESYISYAYTVFEIENPTEEKPSIEENMNSVGYNLLFDSRDNVNFPTKGFFIQFKNNFIREELGSSSNFDTYELAANYFWDINKNSHSVFVSRIFTEIAAGDVPFQGQNFIGKDDLRGYSEGKHRGNQVYAIQCELRQNIYKRFGMIGFLGMGAAVDEISEIPETEILPSIGFGLRYLMIPNEKINVGFDVGFGKDDWSLAFRIGETFNR